MEHKPKPKPKKNMAQRELERMTAQLGGQSPLVTPLGPGNWPSPFSMGILPSAQLGKYIRAYYGSLLCHDIDNALPGRQPTKQGSLQRRWSIAPNRFPLLLPLYNAHRYRFAGSRDIKTAASLKRMWEMWNAEMRRLIDLANARAAAEGKTLTYVELSDSEDETEHDDNANDDEKDADEGKGNKQDGKPVVEVEDDDDDDDTEEEEVDDEETEDDDSDDDYKDDDETEDEEDE
ncbi:hypothetical protein MBM_05166 [Drepanopeziza brunnea f. sp. 'multigermtubi' MB_m1]|uniref:Uncharacterized protein n=1 Tax=Marssonina brunnea f. sp. multigermtubi (strain MB_m1) TaxID=1072389 RepID=K1WW65_MARBU|nr:uncharacterized protein MBM_05166 [Drepanopeziza brunnea f. sp. 'multigermtubi' MB_m1]EKD16697.1 hypothetical protein MBM_05166 [Drepanopeziza brunnea f. sp. 'multigermtubi' MB_m1]